MSKLKNTIVVSSGRCGSHWVESIVIDLMGNISKTSFDGGIHLLPDGWTLHTHDFENLKKYPQGVRESTRLIVCFRESVFDQAISYFVAQQTNEWFTYSDNYITPFTVDPFEFRSQLKNIPIRYRLARQELMPLWPNFFEIKYEDLSNSEIPEKYVAQCLGMKYKKPKNNAPRHRSQKNPRDYQKLILNWDELVAISKEHVA